MIKLLAPPPSPHLLPVLVQRNTSMSSNGAAPSKAMGPAPVAPSGMPNVRPINSLTPYQNKWTICARVTSKSSIRTWSNSRGEGKLFSIDLLDESGEIRATAFNAECDKFFEMLEPNNVYYISVATLKTANKQFSSLKNDYEMSFNGGTQVVPCHEDNSIPAMQFDFISIEQLEKAEKNSIVDLIGVCHEYADISTVIQKSTGRELKKRDLKIIDHSKRSVNLTMWGEQAEKFDGSGCPVLAIKGARVSDFGGVSLSLIGSSTVQINPDISEAHQLKGWWESTGCNSSDVISLSNNRGGSSGGMGGGPLKTFAEAKREGLGSRDQPDFYSCKAIVTLVKKENLLYRACTSEGCNKKVTDMNNGMYRCEKCNKEIDSFSWRLMISCNLADFTESLWVTMFQDVGEIVLGSTAQEMGAMKEENPDMFLAVVSAASFKEYTFKLRVKMDTYNDESRLKTIVQSVEPVNPVEYNKRLIKEIKEMSG
uniref:Replication protein A subunit n=1 Tax=Hirondellea gigas TaxID=1518452 RepID=A0A2P2I042_9CRUS